MEFITLILLAFLVEGITEWIKNFFPKKLHGILLSQSVSIIISVVITFGFNITFFQFIGIKANYVWIEYLLTGLIIARGSHFLNDIWDRFFNYEK